MMDLQMSSADFVRVSCHPRRRPGLARGSIARSLGALVTVFALVAGMTGCATNPVTGKRELSLVSESQEIAMGQASDKSVQAEYGLYNDPALAAYVDSIGQSLARHSERPSLPWHFRVLDSPVVNAFALPGGYVYVTRGLLSVMNSEAQLAAVMGHEVGHVTARHSARQMTEQQIAQLGLGLGSILSARVAQYSGAASQGLGLLFLKFSRDNETEADMLGVRYATRAGYDPREMPDTYVTLAAVAARGGAGRLPTILQTHPDPGDRFQRTTALASDAVAALPAATQRTLTIREVRLKQAVDGLVYGDDPRQGYSEGRAFYHPGLGFQMRWPESWTIQNGSTAVVAVAPAVAGATVTAQMQLSLVQSGDPAAFARQLATRQGVTAVNGNAEMIGGHAAWVGEIRATGAQGEQVLQCAIVQRGATTSLEFLGAPSSISGAFGETARSVRDIDEARRRVTPKQIALARPLVGAPFTAFLATLSGLAAPADEIAMINNLSADERVTTRSIVKIVRQSAPTVSR